MDKHLSPESEVAPYKKKSVKRPPPKSKHKHDYQPCILDTKSAAYSKEYGFVDTRELNVGTYCTICGKIGDVNMFGIDPNETCIAKTLWRFSDEQRTQLNPATRTWPLFRVDDYFKQKFVDLTGGQQKDD